MIGGRLALHLGQIPILAVVALGRAFDEFEEMTQVLALGGFEFRKFDAYAKGRTALGNNPSENDAFDPDLPIGQPETDFHAYSGGYGRRSLDETSPRLVLERFPQIGTAELPSCNSTATKHL